MILDEPSHQKNTPHDPDEVGFTAASHIPERKKTNHISNQWKEGHTPEWSHPSESNPSVALCWRYRRSTPVKSPYSGYNAHEQEAPKSLHRSRTTDTQWNEKINF